MKLKLFTRIYPIIILALLILGTTLSLLTWPPATAASSELQAPNASCNDPNYTTPISPADQYYGQAISLLENQGASTIELLSAYEGYTNTLEKSMGSFSILKEGDTYYLWVASRLRTGSVSTVNSIIQRFESKNGLVWCHRTSTNLNQSDTFYRFFVGPRNVIKSGSLYEGWDEYYYEWSSGWGYALRYITSTNGITWTTVNKPALIGTLYATIIKEGSTYRMWADPHGDSYYQGTRSLRYRTSTNGGTGWGHWQTGGTLINLDGGEVGSLTHVRQLPSGTHQLFYWRGDYIHLATSNNGITFTTQISNLLNLAKTLPITDVSSVLVDFTVVNVGGEDWFYINYCTAISPSGYCTSSHIAVARPFHQAELALSKSVTPTVVRPGDLITYTLTFSNSGPDTATGVIITDILPSVLLNPIVKSNLSLTNTGHSPAYVWQVQNLPPNTKGLITITAQVDPTAVAAVGGGGLPPVSSFTNTATIASTAIETDTTNNSDTVNSVITNRAVPLQRVYLPIILRSQPTSNFLIHIGHAIARRPVNDRGETFYNKTLQLPKDLPHGGHFYFSAQSDVPTKIVIDDELVVLLNGDEVFSYDFSTSGSPRAALVEMPRATLEQLAGQSVTFQYRDIYGVVVRATEVWLIWVP